MGTSTLLRDSNVCLCRYHENIYLSLKYVQRHVPHILLKSSNEFVRASWREDTSENHLDCLGDGQGRAGKCPKDWNTRRCTTSSHEQCTTISQQLFFFQTKTKSDFLEKKKTAQAVVDSVIQQMDFAENYTAAYKDEIQFAHWNQNRCPSSPLMPGLTGIHRYL
ncbi:unnamed protein product [Lepeophtheirus salmonis]|uniref:(salmon louse) hypothetical protein n=1 Tax=Lepeophtheirus salmonis TaxID=72036 RepID=A0A7R8D3L7_LEPSM|nr:unnamed protein product [Lepeophtheirus salmonis]CAF3017860.1 unnamed protein product [Lepeophtheirus salmonis]